MQKRTTDGSPATREEPPIASGTVSHDDPNTARPRSGLGLLARRIHFLAGFAVAPFLAVMCLTGLANAFTPQIVDTVHQQELFVDTDTGAPRPVSDQVAAALAAHPEGTVKAVIPPLTRTAPPGSSCRCPAYRTSTSSLTKTSPST